jgi:hypothetical protein
MYFLQSVNLFEDQWSFIILIDMLLLKRSTIKEFKSSREQINDETHEFNYSFIKATNPLENNTITVC